MKELYSNGFASSIAQAIEEMKAEQGDGFSLDRINLAELERRSGVSRGKLRRLKRNGFQDLPRSSEGRKHAATKLSGYTGIIDSLLRQGIKNSSVIRDRLRQAGFDGGATIVKEYIALINLDGGPSGFRFSDKKRFVAPDKTGSQTPGTNSTKRAHLMMRSFCALNNAD